MNPKDLPAGATIPAGHDWVARARALTPILDAAAPRIDAAKGLPADVQDAVFDARIFRMLLPRSVGGAELDLPTFFEAVYAVARGDASAAWSVAQSNACAMSAAYMTPQAAAELFADPRAVLAWGFPQGPCRMTPVEGGWRVSGVWGFGSGSRHSTWLGGHCQVTDAAGTPLKKADGSARERTALFPRGAVTIVDKDGGSSLPAFAYIVQNWLPAPPGALLLGAAATCMGSIDDELSWCDDGADGGAELDL